VTALRRLTARLRTGPADERGMSLAELLVAMTIFGLLLVVVVGVFATMMRSTRASNSIDQNVRAASVGMNELVREIRSAADTPQANAADLPAFSAAGAESMTFTTLVNTRSTDPVPQRVAVGLQPTTRALVERIYPANDAAATYFTYSSTATTTTLITAVSSTPTGEPALFVYRDAAGNVLAPSASGLTADQMSDIRSVQITLRVANTASMINNALVLSNTVDLPNLADG